VLESERPHHHHNSSTNNTTTRILTMGPSRCFSTQFPVRTGRTFKWLCLTAASLAFCIGIGIGVLIPLYFLPVSPADLVLSQFSTVSGTTPSSVSSQQQIPQSVISTLNSGELDPVRITNSVSYRTKDKASTSSISSSSSDSNSNNVRGHSSRDEYNSNIRPLEPQQLYRRPNPSVQFIAPESRILSLHPVQQEIPPVQYNKGDGWDLLRQSSGSASKPLVASAKKSAYVNAGSQRIVDGIYWGESVEQALPKGFTSDQLTQWRDFVHKSSVSSIKEGCGRMQNRMLTFANGTDACCRYRQNFDQIQGEIFSFYLSQLLGLPNLAPSTLTMIMPSDEKWATVQRELTLAQWVEKKPVVVTKFLDHLSPSYIPSQFRGTNRRLHPMDVVSSMNSVETPDFSELAQWSDLILFDYLTANLDRMVNNLYNLQWNPSMMEAPAHNLAKDVNTGLLVFLDNESGLLHGYRLLDKYEQYHRIMLESLCVFRRSTVAAVKKLRADKNVGTRLRQMFKTLEPSIVDYLPMLPEKSVKILNRRIDRVYDQITKCESLYL